MRRAQKIDQLADQYASCSDAVLDQRITDSRTVFQLGREGADDVNHAIAVVREAAARVLGQRPYVVQMAGALAMQSGAIAEMATGEGKTLTAVLAAALIGWKRRGLHIVTANDYLARRDAEWMAPLYDRLGLQTGFVLQGTSFPERRSAYMADVTYTTSKEVAADYLRDRLVLGRLKGTAEALSAQFTSRTERITDRLLLRGLQHAIVDEADFVLIDEASTPLIISSEARNPEQLDAYQKAADLAARLQPRRHFRVNQRFREVELTAEGKAAIESLSRSFAGLWKVARRREELVTYAITANELYHRDHHYLVDDGKIIIIDESTGRLIPDRTWRDGLHQAVEAKEGLNINLPKETCARMSFQRFFRMYNQLSGMTGTARESAREFWEIYGLPVVSVPTNRPVRRRVLRPQFCRTEQKKWQIVTAEVQGALQSGQPVLIGTRSVRDSELLGEQLALAGIDHRVLNAVRHQQEAQIVTEAGKSGAVTVATNMAGRGTDIRLDEPARQAGGLFVIATAQHESRRIDRQLFGRAARQGDPGTAQRIVSMEDELLRRYASLLRKPAFAITGLLPAWMAAPLVGLIFRAAQYRAGRSLARQRRQVLRNDDWLEDWLGFAGSE